MHKYFYGFSALLATDLHLSSAFEVNEIKRAGQKIKWDLAKLKALSRTLRVIDALQ